MGSKAINTSQGAADSGVNQYGSSNVAGSTGTTLGTNAKFLQSGAIENFGTIKTGFAEAKLQAGGNIVFGDPSASTAFASTVEKLGKGFTEGLSSLASAITGTPGPMPSAATDLATETASPFDALKQNPLPWLIGLLVAAGLGWWLLRRK